MKIQIAKQDLMGALKTVSHSMSTTGGDLSTCFLFRKFPSDSSKVEVLTYAGRVFSSCPIVAQISGEGAFTVEGRRLSTWLSSLKAEDIVTLDCDGGSGTMVSLHRKQVFQSLNPANFPFWDSLIESSTVTAKVAVGRLGSALEYSNNFASDQDNKTPELCVCEIDGGILYSTDRIAATLLTVKGLETCTIRVHTQDVRGLTAYLKGVGGEVDILENERGMFFRGTEGSVYGMSRFQKKFPTLIRPAEEAQHSWVLRVSDIKTGILSLIAGADWADNRLRFTRPDPQGPVQMGMTNVLGAVSFEELECLESSSSPKAPPLPSDGFVLAHPALTKILNLIDGDTVRFGVNVRNKGGYIRFINNKFTDDKGENGDEYLTIISWLK